MRATLRSLGARWGSVLVTGFYVLLMQSLLLIAAVVPAWLLGQRVLGGLGVGGGSTFWVMGLLAVAVPMLVLVWVAPRIAAAFAHMAMQVRRGSAVSFSDLWAAGGRHWRPLFNYLGFLMVVGFMWAIAGMVTTRMPLSPLVWEALSTPFVVSLGGYGVYLIVAEEMLPADALRTAWLILTRKTADLLWTSLIFFLAGQALDWVERLLRAASLVGGVVSVLIGLLVAPVAMLYLAHRYHANIGPTLTPPGGGTGTFDPRPFVGP